MDSIIGLGFFFVRPAPPHPEPLPITAVSSGVVRFDPEKAYDGVNVLTSWTDEHGCQLFNNDGSNVRDLPADFCSFVPGEGIVSSHYSRKDIVFYDLNFKKKYTI